MSRYRNRRTAINKKQQYKDSEIFENRGLKEVRQYRTPVFRRFSREEYDSVRYERHYWTSGDRYWKLANKYYGDPKLWWVIARWNFAPTESHLSEGEEIRIPLDLSRALEVLR